MREFLLHGLRYVFPAEPGRVSRGIATSHSAAPIAKRLVSSDDTYVWPSSDGDVRGQSTEPLYPSAPGAALRDPALYEMLALVDAIRVGRASERTLAVEKLEKRLATTQ